MTSKSKVNKKHVDRFPNWADYKGVELNPDFGRNCCGQHWSDEFTVDFCKKFTTISYFSGDLEQGLGVGICSLECLSTITTPALKGAHSGVSISVIGPMVEIFVSTELKQEAAHEESHKENLVVIHPSSNSSNLRVLRSGITPEQVVIVAPEPAREPTVAIPEPVTLPKESTEERFVPPSFSF